jgi:hypothetical protein
MQSNPFSPSVVAGALATFPGCQSHCDYLARGCEQMHWQNKAAFAEDVLVALLQLGGPPRKKPGQQTTAEAA